MEITEKKQDGVFIFSLQGRLDSNTSPELEKRVFEAIGNGEMNLIIDFEILDYISSAGWRVLLKAAQELKRSNGKIVLCSMKDYIREVFEIAGFSSLLPLVSDMDDALKRF
jgi:anti-sigma B factor antagonist